MPMMKLVLIYTRFSMIRLAFTISKICLVSSFRNDEFIDSYVSDLTNFLADNGLFYIAIIGTNKEYLERDKTVFTNVG